MAKVWIPVRFQHFSASGLRKAWNWPAYWEVLQVSEEEALESLQKNISFSMLTNKYNKLSIHCWYCLKLLLRNKTSSPGTSPCIRLIMADILFRRQLSFIKVKVNQFLRVQHTIWRFDDKARQTLHYASSGKCSFFFHYLSSS